MSSDAEQVPNLGLLIGQVLQRVPAEQQPLLIAIAERMAAERYREWAKAVTPARREKLLACAAREEEIAGRIEGLYTDAAAAARALLAQHPDLVEINRALFSGRPLAQQFLIQAQGERLGAATWRAFAKQAQSESRRGVLAGCALLEEESAVVLETILAEDG